VLPPRPTNITARVRGEIRSDTDAGSRQRYSSTSAKTTWSPAWRIAWFVETKVSGVLMTSSPSAHPWRSFNSRRARWSPAVAELRKWA
jgi:hypothetical protein